MTDLETPTPNIEQLKKALGKTLESETQETSPPESLNLLSQTSSFTNIVNDVPVFTKEDIDEALKLAQDEPINHNKPLLCLSIAPDKESTLIQLMPQIQVDQLRSIVSTLHELKHDIPLSDEDDLTDDEIVMAINSSKASTIGQKAILACSKLKKEVDWRE
eukprot:4051289-Ditylum_brightwellii.AAC.1